MGVWDKGAEATSNTATLRTLVCEAAARDRNKDTDRSLENHGCVGDLHFGVDRCLVFLCMLICCMTMVCRQVAFIEARLADHP